MKRRSTMQTVMFTAALAGAMLGVRSPALASGATRLAGLDLSDLDADERKLFDKVVRGEICPCGSAMSLGKCLQRDDFKVVRFPNTGRDTMASWAISTAWGESKVKLA